MNTTVVEGEGATWRSARGSLNSVMTFAATLLIAWILYRLLQAAKAVAEVKRIHTCNMEVAVLRTLMNLSVFDIRLISRQDSHYLLQFLYTAAFTRGVSFLEHCLVSPAVVCMPCKNLKDFP